MLDVNSRIEKRYDRSFPNIFFENESIILELLDLFSNDMNIYQYIGILLLNLGFEAEDNIFLCNYDKDDSSFDCILNNKERYKIKFNFDNGKIDVIIDNNVYGYECEKIERSELGMRISLGSYTYKYDDGMIFTRVLSRNAAKFMVSICGYMIELELEKPEDIKLPMYDEYGNYAKYRLENEDELIKYFVLPKNFTLSIVELYKQLEELYIHDIRKYPSFSLKISTIMDDGCLDVLGLINLKYGKMEQFGTTDDKGRIVFIDKDDNWSFSMPKEEGIPVNFLMSKHAGRISCAFSYNDDYNLIGEYIPNSISNDMNVAFNKISKTKKKVRRLFDNNGDFNVW